MALFDPEAERLQRGFLAYHFNVGVEADYGSFEAGYRFCIAELVKMARQEFDAEGAAIRAMEFQKECEEERKEHGKKSNPD